MEIKTVEGLSYLQLFCDSNQIQHLHNLSFHIKNGTNCTNNHNQEFQRNPIFERSVGM